MHESLEIQLGEQGLQLVDMRIAHRQFLLAQLDRHVEADRRQPLGQPQVVAPGGDLLALLALDLRHVVEDILHRAPLLHQLAGTLFADARHAGNIVRRIAPQGENVAHEHRIVDTVFGADRLAIDDLDTSFGTFLFVYPTVVAHQLPVVLIGRHHINVVTRRNTLLREGADHVVGLVALDLQHRDTHGVEHPFDIRHREEDILGRLGPVGLVFGENLAAETATLGIERHTQQIGTFAFLNVAQELDESEHNGGVHTRAVAHGSAQECVIILEYQRIGIDQKKFFHI